MGAEEPLPEQPNSDEHLPELPQESSEPVEYTWPVISFDSQPVRTYHFFQQFRTSPSKPNNFLNGVKWSPDGSCFLTSTDDKALHLFPLPHDGSGYYGDTGSYAANADADSYAANLVLTEGEAIYDFCWYPYMSASDPLTCVFATTTRDHPIHLWDSTTGELRCTYRAYDNMDEITAAYSIGFNPSGTKIFAGYNKSIRVFDIHRPGRDCKLHSTVQGKTEGQPGVISTMSFSPTHTGMLATGSYCQSTAIYTEDNMELLYVLHGHEGGVTNVQFSKDGNYLYTGARKDPYILCWDVRKAVDVVYKLYRSSQNTNQRIQFDVDPSGQHLGTGGEDGMVHIYNLQTGQWSLSFQAALDTVNGFSFHPYLPMSASSSGHRRFLRIDDDDDSPEDLNLSGEENCASVWSFSYASMADNATDLPYGDSLNSKSEHENLPQEL